MRAESEITEKIRNSFQGFFILQKEPGKNMSVKEQNPLQPPLNRAGSPGSLASPSWCQALWWVLPSLAGGGAGPSCGGCGCPLAPAASSDGGAWDVPAPPGAPFPQILAALWGGKVPGTSLTLACKVRVWRSSAPRGDGDSHPALCFRWHRHRG